MAAVVRHNVARRHNEPSNEAIISAVIQENNIIVDRLELTPQVRGLLLQDPHGCWRLAANTRHPRYRCLPMAHLLGHYLLHREDQQLFFCCGDYSLAVELEAELFALHFLLPHDLLARLVQRYTSVERIAALTGVPPPVVMDRLEECGIEYVPGK
jgi:Zn-dependent peptidase ImmA (M78 family)